MFHHEKRYSGWGMHGFFSTPILNGLMTFFAWYMLKGTEFGCGSTNDRRRNRSLKLQSDQPYLAFWISSSSTKHSKVQCVGQPFSTPYTASFDAFSPFQKNLDLLVSLVKSLIQGLKSCHPNHLHPRHVLRHYYWHHLRHYHPNHQHHHLIHCQTRNLFMHQALLNIGTGILGFRRRISPYPRR